MKKRKVISSKRQRVKVLGKRLLRGLRNKEVWAEKYVKKKRVGEETLKRWAAGKYRVPSEAAAKKSREEFGMSIWKRRGLL